MKLRAAGGAFIASRYGFGPNWHQSQAALTMALVPLVVAKPI